MSMATGFRRLPSLHRMSSNGLSLRTTRKAAHPFRFARTFHSSAPTEAPRGHGPAIDTDKNLDPISKDDTDNSDPEILETSHENPTERDLVDLVRDVLPKDALANDRAFRAFFSRKLDGASRLSIDEDYDDSEVERDIQQLFDAQASQDDDTDLPPMANLMARMPKGAPGFFNLDEDDEDVMEDFEFEGDDISTPAHQELDMARDVRQLLRVSAFDMPMLWKYRQPWQKPDLQKTPLMFKYTTYMGEPHNGARRVVVEFTPSNLPGLEPQHMDKAHKLLGQRYNSIENTAKMSCSKYPTSAQNKRYLVQLIQNVIDEAKKDDDSFSDIPLDTRHMRNYEKKLRKKAHTFPDAWIMDEARHSSLAQKRELNRRHELNKIANGELVDGTEVVRGVLGISSGDSRLKQEQRSLERIPELVRR